MLQQIVSTLLPSRSDFLQELLRVSKCKTAFSKSSTQSQIPQFTMPQGPNTIMATEFRVSMQHPQSRQNLGRATVLFLAFETALPGPSKH